MKKVYLLTALSAIAIIDIFLPKAKAQQERCPCEKLLSGGQCCFTRTEMIFDCPFTYLVCLDYSSGTYTCGVKEVRFPGNYTCDCVTLFQNRILDIQDTMIAHTLLDTANLPSDSCWTSIPYCPNVICNFEAKYMICYSKDQIEYMDADSNMSATMIYSKCPQDSLWEVCFTIANICRDSLGNIHVYRESIANDSIICPDTCRTSPCN